MRNKGAIVVSVLLFGAPLQAHPGSAICVDRDGNIYFTDTGHGVWKIDQDLKLSAFHTSAVHWMAIDLNGSFKNVPESLGSGFQRISPVGAQPTIILSAESPCVFAPNGNLYYSDAGIRGLTPELKKFIATRHEDKNASAPTFNIITGITAAPDGSLYVVDMNHQSGAHAILQISTNGALSTFATNFLAKLPLPPNSASESNNCRGLILDQDSNLLVAATGRRAVVKITRAGGVETVLQAQSPWSPTDLTLYQRDLYVLEYTDAPPGSDPDDRRNWRPRVRKLTSTGAISTLATVTR